MEATVGSPSTQTNTNMGSMSMNMSMSSISWNTHCFHAKSVYQFVFGCLAVFVMAALSQLMTVNSFRKSMVGHSTRKQLSSQKVTPIILDSERVCHEAQINSKSTFQSQTPQNNNTLFQSLMMKLKSIIYYSVYGLMSLLLMLVAMTMNGYVILSVAIGTGIGKTIALSINEAHHLKSDEKWQQKNESIDMQTC